MNETGYLQAFQERRSEAAFAELVRRYTGLVYSVAKRRLADAALAEDITQIVFIRFARTPPRLKTPGELAAWLHRTTLNAAIDVWRSETRRRAREQQVAVMESTHPEPDVWEEISPKLDEALNQLGDDDRQALLLRFFGRKSMRDVGTSLGVSEDAAKMRVSRAVDRLRTQLNAGGAACTVAIMGTVLAERTVEAVPGQLVSRLANLKLPAAAGTAGFLAALLQVSRFKLAAGAIGLTLIGVGTIHLFRSHVPPAGMATADSPTNPIGAPIANPAGRARPEPAASGGFEPLPAPVSTKAVKIEFHVLDAETGAGLVNTKIHYAFFGAGGQGEGHETLTDANGDAPILEPDDPSKNSGPNVFVTAEGHVPKAVGFHAGSVPAGYTIRLDPAMTVGGVIVDEEGLPVAAVQIKVQSPGDVPGQMENVDFQTCPVTNRADGSWSCSYIPKDYTNEIRFILKKPGYSVTFPVVPVGKVDLKNLVLVLNRGFTVTGRVTDLQGHPIAKARIRTIDGDTSKRQSTRTDENGVYTLDGVPGDAETYQSPPLETNDNGGAIIRGLATKDRMHVNLSVQADGLSSQSSIVDLTALTNVANFTLSSGNVFRGRVVDEAGNPISNAVVQTDYDFNNQVEKRFDWTSHADANGRFEWDSAPAENVCYWFEADGYKVIRGQPLAADGSDHVITLKKHRANE